MEIKQEYKQGNHEFVNFTYIGEPRGVVFDGMRITFRDGNGREMDFFITEIAELIPYFEKWSKS